MYIEIYVETLKQGKPHEQNFTIQSEYTTPRGIQHSIECIRRTGLFASFVTHTAVARLTLLSFTLSLCFYYLCSYTLCYLKVCPSYIYTYANFWLFTYIALMGRTLKLLTSWLFTRFRFRPRPSSRLLFPDSSSVGFLNSRIILLLEGHIPNRHYI